MDKEKKSSPDQTQLQKANQGLQQEVDELQVRIAELEEIVTVYENLQELVAQERRDADQTIRAHESVEDLARSEIEQLRDTVTAHESVEDLARQEMGDLEKTVQAHEQVEKLAGEEIDKLRRLLKVHQRVEALTRDELNDLMETVRAHEAVEELARREIHDLNRTVQAHETVEEFARQELMHVKQVADRHRNESEQELDQTQNALSDAEKTVQAFEKLQEFQRNQFKYYDNLVAAYENVGELFSREIEQLREVIQAHESVEELAREEMVQIKLEQHKDRRKKRETIQQLKQQLSGSEQTIEALSRLMEHQRMTKINLDKTITAYRSITDMSRSELDDAYRTIRVHEELEKLAWDEKREVDSDLMLAQKVQFGLITEQIPDVPDLEFRSRYIPSTRLGGDFFAVKRIREGRIGLFICDTAGHGTQAALITMIVKTLFEEYAARYLSPGSFLVRLNARLFRIVGNVKTFITALYVVIDPVRKRLQYANGGHPYALLRHPDGTLLRLDRTGPLLGAFDRMRYHSRTINLQKNDLIFLYTDGAVECTGPGDEEFGMERIERHVEASHRDSTDRMLDSLYTALIGYHGSSRMEDDVSLVAARIIKGEQGIRKNV